MRRAKAAAIQEVERIQGRCLEVIYSHTKFFVHEDVIFNAVKYFKYISRQEEDYFNF